MVRSMPRRKRYALPEDIPQPSFTEYERGVSIQEDFVQPLALESTIVAELTDAEGLDPVEQEGRRGNRTMTEAERALAVQRLLPHRSTLTPAMQAIHERRFALWLAGVSMDEIAEVESVDNSLVQRSVLYSKSILSRDEVLRANAQHTANRAHLDCADEVSPAILALLSSDNWKAKSAGLTQFRRTVGMEVSAGVNVMVDNRRQSLSVTNSSTQPVSFEEAMGKVRQRLLSESSVELNTAPVLDATVESTATHSASKDADS
jgi:hypothetical protein